MAEWLDSPAYTVELSAEWSRVGELHRKQNPGLYYIDTESFQMHLVELSVLNSAGKVVLSTKVVHANKTWQEIYDSVSSEYEQTTLKN